MLYGTPEEIKEKERMGNQLLKYKNLLEPQTRKLEDIYGDMVKYPGFTVKLARKRTEKALGGLMSYLVDAWKDILLEKPPKEKKKRK